MVSRERFLAGECMARGPLWLVSVARYRDDRLETARAYSDWFERGLSSLRAVGGRWIASSDHGNGCGRVTIVELPSPTALQEMHAKYEFIKRGASPATTTKVFCISVQDVMQYGSEDQLADEDTPVKVIEQNFGDMVWLLDGEGGLIGSNRENSISMSANTHDSLLLKVVLPCALETMCGFAEVSDSTNLGIVFSRRQMHLGKL